MQKLKQKKPTPKKPITESGKKAKKEHDDCEELGKEKKAAEKWSHDLYDDTAQASKSQDELRDRYGYNIRDDEQAPRGKRNGRYTRPAVTRGAGRGSRGFRGGRGGGIRAARGASAAEDATNEPEVGGEKENYHAQPVEGEDVREKVCIGLYLISLLFPQYNHTHL